MDDDRIIQYYQDAMKALRQEDDYESMYHRLETALEDLLEGYANMAALLQIDLYKPLDK